MRHALPRCGPPRWWTRFWPSAIWEQAGRWAPSRSVSDRGLPRAGRGRGGRDHARAPAGARDPAGRGDPKHRCAGCDRGLCGRAGHPCAGLRVRCSLSRTKAETSSTSAHWSRRAGRRAGRGYPVHATDRRCAARFDPRRLSGDQGAQDRGHRPPPEQAAYCDTVSDKARASAAAWSRRCLNWHRKSTSGCCK